MTGGVGFAWRRLVALAAVGLTCAAAAFAEGGPTVTLAASPVERCLTPAQDQRVLPTYPADALRVKQLATVNVELVFDAPDRAPTLHFLAPQPTDDFRASVAAYASQLRVPCMQANAGPVTLRQGFDFTPNDGRKVAWTTPVDLADKARTMALECLAYPNGDDAQIRYPAEMAHQGRQQVVIARVHFAAADRSPTRQILYDGHRASFGKAVAGYLDAMRLPCLPAGATIDTVIKFDFTLEGMTRQVHVLQDLDLQQFVSAAKPAPGDSAYFDTVPMKCPFDIRLTVGEPFEPNRVELLELDEATRRPLADWIARQKLGLTPDMGAEVNGQPMNIHVPCAKIDL